MPRTSAGYHWLFAAWVAQQAKNWPLVVERLQKAASFGKLPITTMRFSVAQQADADSRLKMRETLQAVFARHDKPNMSPDEAAMLQAGDAGRRLYQRGGESRQATSPTEAPGLSGVLAAVNPTRERKAAPAAAR